MFRFTLSTFFLVLALSFSVGAQNNFSVLAKNYQGLLSKADINESGFISIHMNNSKLWLEIPDSIMGRDLLIGSRVEEISSTKRAVAGQMMHNPMMVQFSQDQKSVYLHVINTENKVDNDDSISVSFHRNHVQTVYSAFKIEARNAKNNASVIDVTKFFNNQIPQISPFGGVNPGKPILETTHIIEARAYPKNIEIVTKMGYSGKRKQFICTLHRSILLLPKKPMQVRYGSPRINYYDESRRELSSKYLNSKTYSIIRRWRIEPKKEDIENYKNGELVEPQQPIVFYLDPSIPQKWKPYIKAGIEDWQKAFEAIGFKNAIMAKNYPTNDSLFYPNDITHSCFRYVTTEKANAMGNHWVDPRSGEIIQADVLFYHNVISKLYQWRFTQTAACDPSIRGNMNKVPLDIMGELVRYAVAHEIGHCLGLKHNYRASYAFPVDSLRSKHFTKKYGTTPSIMDYARNNYIAQPEDRQVKLTPPILGVYDYFSIKWAYQPIYAASSSEQEQKILNQWLEEKSNNDMFLFGTKNGMGDGMLDPSVLTESLGDDVVKAGRYGVSNIKLIMQHLIEWTDADELGNDHLQMMYEAVLKQYNQYFKHAEARLGGLFEFDVVNKTHPVKYVPVSRKKQKEAVDFIFDELLSQYVWLKTPQLQKRLGSLDRKIMSNQSEIIGRLIGRSILVRMFTCAQLSTEPYTVSEYLDYLTTKLFNVSTKMQSSLWIRNLQVEYVKGLNNLLKENAQNKGHEFNNLILADVNAELKSIKNIANKKSITGKDDLKKHFSFLIYILD